MEGDGGRGLGGRAAGPRKSREGPPPADCFRPARSGPSSLSVLPPPLPPGGQCPSVTSELPPSVSSESSCCGLPHRLCLWPRAGLSSFRRAGESAAVTLYLPFGGSPEKAPLVVLTETGGLMRNELRRRDSMRAFAACEREALQMSPTAVPQNLKEAVTPLQKREEAMAGLEKLGGPMGPLGLPPPPAAASAAPGQSQSIFNTTTSANHLQRR